MTLPRVLAPEVDQARQLILRKGFGGAQEPLAALCAANPGSDDLLALNTLVTLWTVGYEAASAQIAAPLTNCNSAAILGIASEIAQFTGEEDLRERYLERAAAIDPDHFLVLRSRISSLTLAGNLEESVRLSDHFLELYPEDCDALSSKLTTLSSEKYRPQAWAILDAAPAWFVNTAQYHSAKGRLYFQQRELDKAAEAFRYAVAACPSGASYWSWLGMAEQYRHRYADAEAAAQRALELNARDVKALKTMAAVLSHRGDNRGAKECHNRAEAAIPGFRYQAGLRKARDLTEVCKYAEAAEIFRKVAADAPVTVARTARHLRIQLFLPRFHIQTVKPHLSVALLRNRWGLSCPHTSVFVGCCTRA